ncbi:hypothetical protein GCM10027451_19850 [Geodermatophilus aquaeductus]
MAEPDGEQVPGAPAVTGPEGGTGDGRRGGQTRVVRWPTPARTGPRATARPTAALMACSQLTAASRDGLVERRGTTLDGSLQRLCMELARAPDRLDDLCDHVLATMLGIYRAWADDLRRDLVR